MLAEGRSITGSPPLKVRDNLNFENRELVENKPNVDSHNISDINTRDLV